MVVGKLHSFWETLFSGAMLLSGRVINYSYIVSAWDRATHFCQKHRNIWQKMEILSQVHRGEKNIWIHHLVKLWFLVGGIAVRGWPPDSHHQYCSSKTHFSEHESNPTNLMGITGGVMKKMARHLKQWLLGWATALDTLEGHTSPANIQYIYIYPSVSFTSTLEQKNSRLCFASSFCTKFPKYTTPRQQPYLVLSSTHFMPSKHISFWSQ